MGLIKEPKNVDFTVNSKPWTEADLQDFREIMKKLKKQNIQTVQSPLTLGYRESECGGLKRIN